MPEQPPLPDTSCESSSDPSRDIHFEDPLKQDSSPPSEPRTVPVALHDPPRRHPNLCTGRAAGHRCRRPQSAFQ
jgi:hypothetical protein